MEVLIVDYDMGNLGSLHNSLQSLKANVLISDNPQQLSTATHIILPGQGTFKDGMAALHEKGWVEALQAAHQQGKPMLGICLGMQLFASKGFEGGDVAGLNLIPGEVRKLEAKPNFRIPHMGWNSVQFTQPSVVFENITDCADFYFCHSYHYMTEPSAVLGVTEYDITLNSIIGTGNILGVQFHPEKSAVPGKQLIENFLKYYHA